MFRQWILDGVAAGVRICSGALTVIVIFAAVLGVVGLWIKLMRENDDEIENDNRNRSA